MVDGLNEPSFERCFTQAGRSHDGAIGAGIAAFGCCFFDKGCLLQPAKGSVDQRSVHRKNTPEITFGLELTSDCEPMCRGFADQREHDPLGQGEFWRRHAVNLAEIVN